MAVGIGRSLGKLLAAALKRHNNTPEGEVRSEG